MRATIRRLRGWPVALLVTAAFVAVAAYLADLGGSAHSLATADPLPVAGVIGLSLLMAALRAARLAALVTTPAWPVVRASLVHNAANAILPARLGEAALPIALSRYAGMDMARGIGLLLMVRLSDLAMLGAFGLMLAAFLDIWPSSAVGRLAIASTGVALAICTGILPAIAGAAGRRVTGRAGGLSGRIAATAETLGHGSALSLVVATVAIWTALALASQLSLVAVGIEADPALAALACVAASLAFALPVNGIASVGPFEAAFTGVLVGGGLPAEQALAAAMLLHLCAIAAAGMAGGAALLSPRPRNEVPLCR